MKISWSTYMYIIIRQYYIIIQVIHFFQTIFLTVYTLSFKFNISIDYQPVSYPTANCFQTLYWPDFFRIVKNLNCTLNCLYALWSHMGNNVKVILPQVLILKRKRKNVKISINSYDDGHSNNPNVLYNALQHILSL